jgi:hypothetical protein
VPATPENTITPRREIKNYQIKSLINLRYTALSPHPARVNRPDPVCMSPARVVEQSTAAGEDEPFRQ